MLNLIPIIILAMLTICLTIFLIISKLKNKKLYDKSKFYKDKSLETEDELTKLKLGVDSLNLSIDEKNTKLSRLTIENDNNLKTIEILNSNNTDLSSRLEQQSSELQSKINELNGTQKKLRLVNSELVDKRTKLDLIQGLLNCKKCFNKGVQNYLNLLTDDYYEFAKNNDSLADEANALLRLQKVANDLDFLSSDKKLQKKTIIAIAGQFSSGKSSFLNSIFKDREVRLPTDLNQSTAINAFIINNETQSISAYTNDGGYSNIEQKQFELFNYHEINYNNFNIKKIVDHFVINNSFLLPLDNICFIDTPGYNPGIYTEDDYASAITSVENSNGLIWCVSATNGTIHSDDIDLLSKFKDNNPNLKIYIIVNKADLRPDEENISILEEINYNVQDIGIEGVCLYTSNELLTNQDNYINQYIGTDLFTFLESLNHQNDSKQEALIQEIESVYQDYINADLSRIANNKKKLENIKKLEYLLTTYIDNKDNQILYLRARLDWAYMNEDFIKNLDKDFNADNSDDEDIVKNDKMAEYIQIVHDVKDEINKIIKFDEKDIEKANILSKKMKSCIFEAFA